MHIQHLDISTLKPLEANARTHSQRQIDQIGRSIKDFGFNNPILIDKDNKIIAGHGRFIAAQKLGFSKVPVICLDHMDEQQKRAYILADNKLAEKAGWDKDILKIELQHLLEFDINFDLTMTGFETPELDLLLYSPIEDDIEEEELPDEMIIPQKVHKGDLWKLGEHYLYCGDSLSIDSFAYLMKDQKAALVFTDPPYNVSIPGHVSGKGKIKHEDFAFASGEMSATEFTHFLQTSLTHLRDYSKDGSIHYVCIDWRHMQELLNAGNKVYQELKNVCIWNKQLPGMGSLYRSQHEMIFVFKNGNIPHKNNIELGKHGRNRSNIWDYPGVHVSNSHSQDLKLHPTVKPISLVKDAIIDCSNIGDIVLDCFGGSGSTLLAAEQCKRKARLIEFEPHYCDVILYRYEDLTKNAAELVGNYA